MHSFLFLFFIFLPLSVFAQQDTYTVRRGDDFDAIAKRYGITVAELQEANSESKVCYVGRKLMIPKHGVPVERKHVTEKDIDFHLTSNAEKKQLPLSVKSSYQVGEALWKNKEYDGAIVYLQVAADRGETRAYYPLAESYSLTKSSLKNERLSSYYYLLAVENSKDKYNINYQEACLKMSECYMYGVGVEKSLKSAKRYAEEYKRYSITPSDRYNKIMRMIRKEELTNEEAIRQRKLEEIKQKNAVVKSKTQVLATIQRKTIKDSGKWKDYLEEDSLYFTNGGGIINVNIVMKNGEWRALIPYAMNMVANLGGYYAHIYSHTQKNGFNFDLYYIHNETVYEQRMMPFGNVVSVPVGIRDGKRELIKKIL